MSRLPRVVIPGLAHHVTQRGNRRMRTFFGPGDYERYRDLLADGVREAGVDVLAYCLMPNHVHLVLVPSHADGLRRALATVHQKYTWIVNRREGWRGHLWQERFHSFPMDDDHLLRAARYVELNPVRAGLAETPDAWAWSSARAHLTRRPDALVTGARKQPLAGVADWRAFLDEALAAEELATQRLHIASGAPLGSDSFVRGIEAIAGRRLVARPRGRPSKNRDSQHFRVAS